MGQIALNTSNLPLLACRAEPAPQVSAANEQADQQGPCGGEDSEDTAVDEDDCKFADEEAESQSSPGRSTPKKQRLDAFAPNRTPAGAVVERSDTKEFPSSERPFNEWARLRIKFHRPLAEFLGALIFAFIECGGDLAVVTSQQNAGTLYSTYWNWGFVIMFAIYVAGGGSGGFINPALTVMLSFFRGFPARRIPTYILARAIGCFVGALLAVGIYLDGELIPDSTGLYLYTQPKPWVSAATTFFTEFLGIAVLGCFGCCTLALGDSGNSPPGAGMPAFAIGLLVQVLVMSFGYTTHGCFNPARDLGPRLAAMAAGYPTSLFTASNDYWIWGAWGAPICGALAGALLYGLCIFRGGESPVNFSYTQYKLEGRKGLRAWLRTLGRDKEVKESERKIGEGIAHERRHG
ncbi:aquaporin [Hortaea werneckii]|nr:aquaporin [Hortaea werneckii]